MEITKRAKASQIKSAQVLADGSTRVTETNNRREGRTIAKVMAPAHGTRKRRQELKDKIPRLEQYRQGGEGFVKWAEDKVRVKIFPPGSSIAVWVPLKDLPTEKNPETNRSYKDMWEMQQEYLLEALRMKDDVFFIHRLIVLCWQRGDGKSLLVCLIVLWRFMNWPAQLWVLGANSRDQVRFVHFDILTEIILNSPAILSVIGRKNIQQKQIVMRDGNGEIASRIMPISSYSGIVSNITGYTFSEIFQMRDTSFFEQLDGSTRTIPNALGLIDSTVSTKDHPLYGLYKVYMRGSDPSLYFSHRYSRDADPADFMNPNMTLRQLNAYKQRMRKSGFNQFFKNTWDSGSQTVFNPTEIELIRYLGADKSVGNVSTLKALVKEKVQLETAIEHMVEKGIDRETLMEKHGHRLEAMESRLMSVDSIYTIGGKNQIEGSLAPIEAINALSDMYDSAWAVMAGMDRADPYSRTSARTIVTVILKGLTGSRSNRYVADPTAQLHYIYFLVGLFHIPDDTLESVLRTLTFVHEMYGGVDTFGSERWGAWDIANFCEEKVIALDIFHPTVQNQRSMFTEFYTSVRDNRFKAPTIWVPGSREDDILREEMRVFDENTSRTRKGEPTKTKKTFGSPEKYKAGGIQDDAVFSVGVTLHGGRTVGADDLRNIGSTPFFGMLITEKTHGIY